MRSCCPSLTRQAMKSSTQRSVYSRRLCFLTSTSGMHAVQQLTMKLLKCAHHSLGPSPCKAAADCLLDSITASHVFFAVPRCNKQKSVALIAQAAAVNFIRGALIAALQVQGLSSSCCGMMFNSRGFKGAASHMGQQLEQSLVKASDGGKIPIVMDTSPCLAQMKGALTDPALRSACWLHHNSNDALQ